MFGSPLPRTTTTPNIGFLTPLADFVINVGLRTHPPACTILLSVSLKNFETRIVDKKAITSDVSLDGARSSERARQIGSSSRKRRHQDVGGLAGVGGGHTGRITPRAGGRLGYLE